jgi:hypothetical protein
MTLLSFEHQKCQFENEGNRKKTRPPVDFIEVGSRA